MAAETTHVVVDMRSDTLTLPTEEMYKAMVSAPVGNEGYGEDPTVHELTKKCANLLGKESALFVPSGTMGNLLCIMIHCDKIGCEIITGDRSHIFLDEQGGSAQFARAQVHTVTTLPDGTFDLDEMVSKIRDASDYHNPESTVVCVENTQNNIGGKALPLAFLKQLYEVAHNNGLSVHMDGARIWNAAVALNTDVKTIAQYCDTISACFTKGLACPVGSVIAGPAKFIERCRRSRKGLGGTMRQVGVLAGAAIYALDNVFPLLKEDHRRAEMLLRGILNLQHKEVSINQEGTMTNMVRIDVDKKYDVNEICKRLKKTTEEEKKTLGETVSVVVEPCDHHAIRFVTFLGHSDEDIIKAIKKCAYVFNDTFN